MTTAENPLIETGSAVQTTGASSQSAIEKLSNYSTGTGFIVTRVFDERTGLQLTQTATIGSDTTKVQDLQYTYDKLGNVSERFNKLTSASRREVFTYDALNRLTKVRQTNDITYPVPTGLVDTMVLSYDVFGNLASKQVGASATNAQTYDYCDDADSSCGQPHAVKVVPAAGSILETASFTYDGVGNQRMLTKDRTVSGTTYRKRRLISYHWMGRAVRIDDYDLKIQGGNTVSDPDGLDAMQFFDYGPNGEMVFRSSSIMSNGTAVYPIPKDAGGNGNGNGRHPRPPEHGRRLGNAYGHDPEYLAALRAMDARDIQRPLKYAALRRSPKQPNNAKLILAKETCGTTTPTAVPLNDVLSEIFGNTEFIYGSAECEVGRRRNIGGYVQIEQRKKVDRALRDKVDWSTNTATIYTYTLTDPLGSVDVQVRMIANDTYTASATWASRNPRRLSFDAHGQQRFAANTDNNGDGDYVDAGEGATWAAISTLDLRATRTEGSWRGYAGHENYNAVGIVHMKGRIYDPLLGRFLQPDVVVEDALDPQSWNRYSYVRNNPMTFNDPTGFIRGGRECGPRCKEADARARKRWVATIGSMSEGGGAGKDSDQTAPKGSSPASTSKDSGADTRQQSDGDRLCGSNNKCRGAYDAVLSTAEILGLVDALFHGGELGVQVNYVGLAPGSECSSPHCDDRQARKEYQDGKNIATGVMLAGGEAPAFIAARPTATAVSGGMQALRVEANVAKDVANSAPSWLDSLPFRNGEVILREFNSSKGMLDLAAEIQITGRTLHLKDIAVFPRGTEALEIGAREVAGFRNQLAQEARSLGFDQLRITGTRVSGANPGKAVDVSVDLTRSGR